MCAGKTTSKIISHCRDRVHYAVSDTTPRHPKKKGIVLKVCRWSIAAGKRPVPFRTRKLSLHTLMVLQPGGCGRVSHRRHQTTNTTKYNKEEEDGIPPPSSFCVLPALPAGGRPHLQSQEYGTRASAERSVRVKGQNVCLARRVAGVRFGLFECRLSGCSRCR